MLIETASSPSSPRHEMLQAGLDLLDQGITVFDADLRLVAWNRPFLRLLEFPDELAERQLDVIIDWGRYAELIDYDDRTETLRLDPSVSRLPVAATA